MDLGPEILQMTLGLSASPHESLIRCRKHLSWWSVFTGNFMNYQPLICLLLNAEEFGFPVVSGII